MTKLKHAEPVMRSPQQVKADALALVGKPSLVARADAATAADTDAEPAAPADQGTVGEIWLYGVVGGWWWGFDAESVANAIRGMDVDTLYVRIHSPGGIASEGIAISNLLRNHKANVVTVVDGHAASAASVIAIAGDEVVMCPGSRLMLHDASTGACVWGTADELRTQADEVQKVADYIDGVSQNYASVYAYRAGNTAAHWREVMQANGQIGTWYGAEEAVAAGLADMVGTRPAIGSPPVAPADALDEEFDGELDLAKVAHDLQVLEQCVPAAARAAWNGERPKPPTASADGNTHTEGGSAVALSDEQITMRQKLGIAEDADEATVLAALEEALAERADPPAVPNSPEIPDGHVVIPAAKLADLEAGAALATTTAQSLHDKERDTFLDSVRTKYLPTSRTGWEAEYDRDEAGVRAHFASAPVLVPTNEIGHGDQPEDDSDDAFEAAHAAVLAKHGFATKEA